ncbi:MAG: alpha/beta hydrolase, partial [bacterium]|nr:alpha/beta hydrolase [bacterium]
MLAIPIEGGELYGSTLGSGKTCLMLHGGFGFDQSFLRPWLDPLAQVMRLVYFDQRGCGRSAGVPPPNTIAQLCADVEAVRACVGAARTTLLAHGFGGFVALEYALRYPERIDRLILVNSAPTFPIDGEAREAILQRGAIDRLIGRLNLDASSDDDQALGRAVRDALPLLFFDPRSACCEEMLATTAWSAQAAFQWRSIFGGWSVCDRLAKIAVPTLILAGERNVFMPPSQAYALHEGIVNSQLRLFKASGHFPYAEEPALFFDRVLEWL